MVVEGIIILSVAHSRFVFHIKHQRRIQRIDIKIDSLRCFVFVIDEDAHRLHFVPKGLICINIKINSELIHEVGLHRAVLFCCHFIISLKIYILDK